MRVDLNGGGDAHPAVSVRQPASTRAASGQGGGGSAAGGAGAGGAGAGAGGPAGGAVRIEQPGERPGSRQELEATDVFARLLDKQNYVGVARVAHGGQVTPRGGSECGGGDAAGEPGHAAGGEPPGTPGTGGYACSSVITGHAGHVNSMIAAKGQLFSASQDQTVRVWGLQADGFRHVAELAGHHGLVRALAVSGGGALLFSGSQDRTVRVWDTHTHLQLCALSGHQEEVRALAVHNENLYSGSEDSTIKASQPLPRGSLPQTQAQAQAQAGPGPAPGPGPGPDPDPSRTARLSDGRTASPAPCIALPVGDQPQPQLQPVPTPAMVLTPLPAAALDPPPAVAPTRSRCGTSPR